MAVAERQRLSVVDYMGEVLPPARRDEILLGLPAQMNPARFEAGLKAALIKTPELLNIHPTLVRNEVVQWVARGLTFDPYFAEVYLIVRKNFRKQRDEPAAMIGVNGLKKLVRQSGLVGRIYAEVVYANDRFDVQLGLNKDLQHVPDLSGDRGPMKFAYAVAHMADGDADFRVMGLGEIEKIREHSDGWKAFKAGRIKSTPWSEWPERMAEKTVLRALLKTLPQSSELAEILRREEEAEISNDNEETPIKRGPGRPPRLASALQSIAGTTRPEPQPARPEPKPAPQPDPDDDNSTEADPGEIADEIDPETGEVIGNVVERDGAIIGTVIDADAEIVDEADPEIAIDPTHKDYLRGQEDQRNGVKKVLSQAIKNDETRFAHWKAGWDDAEHNG